MKHRVSVTALCLKTAAREQTTCAASQGINQLLAPFNYYLLFYGFDKVFNGIKASSLSAIVIQFGYSEIAQASTQSQHISAQFMAPGM